MTTPSVGTPLLWLGFTLFVLVALVLDLGLFHRHAHKVSLREALGWSAVWTALALLFNLGVAHWFGPRSGLEFLTGYLIELALSVDNLFVFLVIFSYFSVPDHLRHRVLFWGILGAMVMRITFILAGAALLSAFHWIEYVFGGFLIYTGLKILLQRGAQVHPDQNVVLKLARRLLPVTKEYHGSKFLVRVSAKSMVTPLLLVLIVVETTDLVFAVDSIPAIFAITRDPFIVYTSNIFAILGLRSLFFLLAGMMDRFHYLPVGLGLVLAFVGLKMVVGEHYPISIGLSLGVVAALLGGSVLASLALGPRPSRK
jgi:TerC family integral membrane protein